MTVAGVWMRDAAVGTPVWAFSCRAGLYRRGRRDHVSVFLRCAERPICWRSMSVARHSAPSFRAARCHSAALPRVARCRSSEPSSLRSTRWVAMPPCGRSRSPAAAAALRSCDQATPPIEAAPTPRRGTGRATGVREFSSPFNLPSRASCPRPENEQSAGQSFSLFRRTSVNRP